MLGIRWHWHRFLFFNHGLCCRVCRYVLQAERRIPILFAKRLQDEDSLTPRLPQSLQQKNFSNRTNSIFAQLSGKASGQGSTDDAGQSYLPIKLKLELGQDGTSPGFKMARNATILRSH